jgi:hypothetical protein
MINRMVIQQKNVICMVCTTLDWREGWPISYILKIYTQQKNSMQRDLLDQKILAPEEKLGLVKKQAW